jgi:demethylmenaquinone methyltransferase/2-methoxy-6-polyprenyl-1,4-benzoquinol methylase
VRRRYDNIARFIPLFDRVFFLPRDSRSNAVARLELNDGDSVLDIGCGTGRSLGHLREAVGPSGRVYGIDISRGMLRQARKLCAANRWSNVELIESDAAEFTAPTPLNGVLFSLSYNTMPHHRAVLRQAWDQLVPGGRLVIMDAKVPPGLSGKLVLPFSLWLMKHTMLGNPLIHPWEELAVLTDAMDMTQRLFRSYYICCGVKPVGSSDSAANNDDGDAAYRIAAE